MTFQWVWGTGTERSQTPSLSSKGLPVQQQAVIDRKAAPQASSLSGESPNIYARSFLSGWPLYYRLGPNVCIVNRWMTFLLAWFPIKTRGDGAKEKNKTWWIILQIPPWSTGSWLPCCTYEKLFCICPAQLITILAGWDRNRLARIFWKQNKIQQKQTTTKTFFYRKKSNLE